MNKNKSNLIKVLLDMDDNIFDDWHLEDLTEADMIRILTFIKSIYVDNDEDITYGEIGHRYIYFETKSGVHFKNPEVELGLNGNSLSICWESE